jgi:hypothetical protein
MGFQKFKVPRAAAAPGGAPAAPFASLACGNFESIRDRDRVFYLVPSKPYQLVLTLTVAYAPLAAHFNLEGGAGLFFVFIGACNYAYLY